MTVTDQVDREAVERNEASLAAQQAAEMIPQDEIIRRLSDRTTGILIHRKKWRISKSLTEAQKQQMAESFAAESQVVSGTKKLIESSNESYRAVNRVLEEVYSYWLFNTTPYPQHGVRLINRDRLEEFREGLLEYDNRLVLAVEDFQQEYDEIVNAQRNKLGQLFNASDYPQSIEGLYEISFDLVDINPPSYLANLNPELFDEQMRRANERISHSIALLEDEFLKEMEKFVTQIVNGLGKSESGKKASLRESSIEKLNTFFSRFNSLNLNSSSQINSLVSRAKQAMDGKSVTDLRSVEDTRNSVREAMTAVQNEIHSMLETRVTRQFDVD